MKRRLGAHRHRATTTTRQLRQRSAISATAPHCERTTNYQRQRPIVSRKQAIGQVRRVTTAVQRSQSTAKTTTTTTTQPVDRRTRRLLFQLQASTLLCDLAKMFVSVSTAESRFCLRHKHHDHYFCIFWSFCAMCSWNGYVPHDKRTWKSVFILGLSRYRAGTSAKLFVIISNLLLLFADHVDNVLKLCSQRIIVMPAPIGH